MSLSTDEQDPSKVADEPQPLAVAAHSEQRLASALRRIAVGEHLPSLYADLDAFGMPVVRFGPLPAAWADRVSEILELAGTLSRAVHGRPAPHRTGGGAPC